MRSWMTCSSSIRIGLALLLAAALAAPLAAQETLDQRYERAKTLFNSAKVEDACETFQQIEKEKPGYKDVASLYLKVCAQTIQSAYAMEEKLYKEGVDLMNAGRLDEARGKLEQAQKLQLKSPKYRTQIARYLKEMDDRDKEEKLFQFKEYEKVKKLRQMLFAVKPVEAMEALVKRLSRYTYNEEFLDEL